MEGEIGGGDIEVALHEQLAGVGEVGAATGEVATVEEGREEAMGGGDDMVELLGRFLEVDGQVQHRGEAATLPNLK